MINMHILSWIFLFCMLKIHEMVLYNAIIYLILLSLG